MREPVDVAAAIERSLQDLLDLGVVVPLFLAHDVGCLFALPAEQYEIGPRVDPQLLQQRRPNLPPLVDAIAARHPVLAIRLHGAAGEAPAVIDALAAHARYVPEICSKRCLPALVPIT